MQLLDCLGKPDVFEALEIYSEAGELLFISGYSHSNIY